MNSLWIDFDPKNSSYPSFSEDSNADVCVIGAGIFGLTCAYYLTQLGFHVTVFEKDSIGEKTTGHTTAKITSQHGLFYQYLMDSYGSKFAHDYLEANELAIERIKDIVDNEKIKCDFSCQNNYVYTTKKSELSMIKKEVSCVTSLGFPCEFVTKTGLPFGIDLQKPERTVGSPEAGITAGVICLIYVGTWHGTWVLCKSSAYS